MIGHEPRHPSAAGQASVLLVGALAALLVGALIVGAVARGMAREGAAQRAADLAALAGARAMYGAYPRLFAAPLRAGRPNPNHLDVPAYEALARGAAGAAGRANGAGRALEVTFPDGDSFAPVRIRVRLADRLAVGPRRVDIAAVAEAELAPGATLTGGGGYAGPFAYRMGRPMRPDVALAFDRLDRAARADHVELTIASAYRSDAEQQVLWARHPDPRWVARPGESLHRYGTELDLGPASAYGWLAANAPRFHFIRRYENEPWHFGYALNAASTIRGTVGDGAAARPVPDFVPPHFAPVLNRAAQRWNVSAALLAAQLYAESGFNPFATSAAGAEGIAQFMPGTASALGLDDPFDAASSIDAQAHLMRDLLRRFAAVPLALAAYNAGTARVAACGCVPPIPETVGYVSRILGLLGGAGEPAGGLAVRLVR
jgi:soluble lytic murein transglycosylase-like protein